MCYTVSHNSMRRDAIADTVIAPASGAISWQAEVVDGHQWESVFAGKPSKETDDAWHNLLEPINLKVTADEMERLGQTSLAFSDGSGYLGTLGVYHELHCIKRLRKWFYKDYYYQNQTHEQMLEHESHTGKGNCKLAAGSDPANMTKTIASSFCAKHRSATVTPQSQASNGYTGRELNQRRRKERCINASIGKVYQVGRSLDRSTCSSRVYWRRLRLVDYPQTTSATLKVISHD